MASIGRLSDVAEQNMQHFMSQSPWSARTVLGQMQQAVAARAELAGGMLILDESGVDKQGASSAGVSRQYNGRQHKVEQTQVGVYLSYAQGETWTWVDGELYLPERWFSPAYAARRAKAEVPPERVYQSKGALGWAMIVRAKAAGLPFVAVAFDSFYGHDAALRERCRERGLEYYADIHASTLVSLQPPQVGLPTSRKGPRPKHKQVLNTWAYRVEELVNHPDTVWRQVVIRPDARGMLVADFATRQVWTVRPDGTLVAETLLLRRDKQRVVYTLTNAPFDTPLETLARRKSQRYFIERAHQEAKSELGFDHFQALKFRAWEHHLALTLLASWFIAETRLDWTRDLPRDPSLAADYAMGRLPALSVANVRELLRAALPLPTLSPLHAAHLVVKHLDNRTRSRRSRLRNRSGP
jgi:SRSO17 transposase